MSTVARLSRSSSHASATCASLTNLGHRHSRFGGLSTPHPPQDPLDFQPRQTTIHRYDDSSNGSIDDDEHGGGVEQLQTSASTGSAPGVGSAPRKAWTLELDAMEDGEERSLHSLHFAAFRPSFERGARRRGEFAAQKSYYNNPCLLYTSDAADE